MPPLIPLPHCITVLNDHQRNKNKLLDKIYEFKKEHLTKSHTVRKNKDSWEILNTLIVTAQELGYLLNKKDYTLYHLPAENAKPERKVGKTPLRYDWSFTPDLEDLDPEKINLYNQLVSNYSIRFIEFKTVTGNTHSLRPGEVDQALTHFGNLKKSRLTHAVVYGLYTICTDGTANVKNGCSGRMAEKHSVSIEDIFKDNMDAKRFQPVYLDEDLNMSFGYKKAVGSDIDEPVPF